MGQHKFKVGDRARVTRDFMDVRKGEIVMLDSRAPYAAPAWHVVTNACKMVWVAEAVLAPLTAPAKAEEPAHRALDVQVGGGHYKDMAIQPIEYIMANAIPFPEGAVIKYVTRWRAKNGAEDLKKARHMLDMIIEAVDAGNYS